MERNPPPPPNNDLVPQQFNFVHPLLHVLERRALLKMVLHPLNFANVLIKLGHDPYPLYMGKKWRFFGPICYFHPNLFRYIQNIYLSHGMSTIYTGIVANLAGSFVRDLCCTFIVRFMDAWYPELGGRTDNLAVGMGRGRNERELTAHQRLRVFVRQVIRDTVSECCAAVAARPFMVIMIRQIAQHISGEHKYLPTSIAQPLQLIGVEEGWAGLFAGLVPHMIGNVLFIWGTAAVRLLITEGVNRMEPVFDLNDRLILFNFAMGWSTLFLSFSRNPFDVVGTVMAVNGSGLTIPTLLHAPLFSHWSDAYAHLSPVEFRRRGPHIFFRRETGPVTVGTDGKLYAAASSAPQQHFI